MTGDELDIDAGDNGEASLPSGRREGRSVIPGIGKNAQRRQRRRSMKQEDRIASEIGGRRVPGSGAVRSKAHNTRGSSGDVDSSTLEFYRALGGREQCVVSSHTDVGAGEELCSALTDEYRAGSYRLTRITLYAASLTVTISAVS